jgi:hypothetical protein
MRFRKKPVVVEAVKLGYDETYPEWFDEAVSQDRIVLISQGSQHPMYAEINTAEGRMIASPGDWIIKGVEGELYPCKPSVFDKTYEFDADGVVDTWAGNWIVTIDAPNGLQDSYFVDPLLVENSHMPVSDMILGPAPPKIRELFDRRNEKPDG